MKRKAFAVARNWLVGTVLFVGFVYSVFALTVNAKPVYASSCNCSEEINEAFVYCQPHGGIRLFACPVGNPPEWEVLCNDLARTMEFCSGT